MKGRTRKPFSLRVRFMMATAAVVLALSLAYGLVAVVGYMVSFPINVNEQPIKLTAFEYTIIETLIRNAGKVVSKDSLMLQLYPDAELRESHTVDVLMGRLRKKLQAEHPVDVITTVRGQGYRFDIRP